jgi:hypothetical protein
MRKRLSRLAIRCSGLALAVFAAGTAHAQAPFAPPPFVSWAPLGEYERTAFAEQGALRVVIPTKQRDVEIAFTPQSVLSEGYGAERVDGSGLRRGDAAPAFTAYTGRIEGGSRRDFAKLGVSSERGRLEGLLRVDGAYYRLDADLAPATFVIDVREVDPAEVAALAKSCGVVTAAATLEQSATDTSSTAPTVASASTLREIELGTEADAPFVAQTGGASAANARILSIVNMVNGIYETELGLTNRVVLQRTRTGTDPYTTTDSSTLLDQFRSQFLANISTVYDDAMLFSGRDFDGSTVGVAFVDAACTQWRFGVSQFLNQSDSTTALIVAHEEGHTLGANHTSDGIMAPAITGATYFNQTSKDEIAQYVGSVSCLSLTTQAGVNHPPTLTPLGPQMVSEGQTLTLQLTATDPDGDPITYGAMPLPEGASLAPDGLFSWTPIRSAAGCNATAQTSIQFSASDGTLAASESVPISVADVNTGAAPVLSDPADRTVFTGRLMQLQLQASDADGDSITFAASNLPSGAALSAGGAFSWTPSAPQTANVTFQATDCTGRSATQSVQIDVTALPAPHLAALSESVGNVGDVVTLTGSALQGKKVKVRFAGKKATLLSVSDTSITLRVPKAKKKLQAMGAQPVTLIRDKVSADNVLSFDFVNPAP